MRILQLTNKFPYPPKDGGSIATLGLAKSFAAEGHSVTVLAMNTSKHYIDLSTIPDSLKESGIRFIGIPVDTDIRLIRLARNFFFSGMPYNAERFISQAFDEKLKELLQEEGFDVIQLEGLYLAPYLNTIRKYSKVKVAMRAHNIEHEMWRRAYRQEKGLKKFYFRHLAGRIRKLELRVLNDYDALIPITERDGKELARMGCRLPVHVVPSGINSEDFQFSYEEMEFPSVFHIGALDWIPNQEGLLWFFEHAWGKIHEKYPGVRFYLAGRNATTRMKNLDYPNVVFLGEVEDAYAFMRSKAVMIVPILSGSGMRIKIIEGMATGRAIVTTSLGTEGISTTHGENILVADEPDAFAREVCSLLADDIFYRKIGENARKFVSVHYDNQSITRSLIEFYEKLIS